MTAAGDRSVLAAEIAAQPEALRRFRELEGTRAVELGARLARGSPAGMLVAARGSSDHAAVYAKYLFGQRVGLPVALAAPSLVTAYRARLALDGWVVAGISQSGASPDVVAVVSAARAAGRPTVAITDREDSDLARAAEHVVPLRLGGEISVAATGSFTTTLFALAHIAAGWGGAAGRSNAHAEVELDAVASAAAGALAAAEAARAAAAALADAPLVEVIGRGYGYPIALELALKLKEMAGVPAQPYSAADYRHGPIALASAAVSAVLLDQDGPTRADLCALREELLRRGVRTLVVGDGANADVPIPAGPDWLAPVPLAIAGQLLAFQLARRRGSDPDRPAGIQKVTRTF